ncbi:MAG: polyamine aminopropyltransferase [Thermoproteota archaeon]
MSAAGRLVLQQPSGPISVYYKIKRVLLHTRSRYQDIAIVELEGFGKTLVLDGLIQSSVADEHYYHEFLVHPAMVLHPEPEKILVIGGGEGATLREVLKHSTVREAVMVDIDEVVVEVSKKYLEEMHQGSFDDPRARVVVMDGFEYMKQASSRGERFDVIIMDLTDPYGSEVAATLYSREAFQLAKSTLREGGVLVTQAGSRIYFPEGFKKVMSSAASVFKIVMEYGFFVPSFGYINSFVIASDTLDPLNLSEDEVKKRLEERGVKTKVFTPERFRAAFALGGLTL